jgi:flagellar biogenesis protein FliO
MKRRVATQMALLVAGLAPACWSLSAHAQQATDSLAMATGPIALPGIGRVVLAFVLVAALAVGTAVALRRFGSKLAPAGLFAGTSTSLRVLERLRLGADLHVHLVQTEHGKVLITAHRHSIAVVKLDPAANPGGQP